MSDGEQLKFNQELVEKQAADWVGKLGRGLSAAEEDELFNWIALDPRHGECLAELKADWDGFDVLSEWRPVDSKFPNPDLLKGAPSHLSVWKRLSPWIGVAAAVALGFLAIFWLSNDSTSGNRYLAAGDGASSYERHVLEDGSTVELNRGAQVAIFFGADERRLELIRGEAHFSVAHNPNRPFVVTARSTEVTAIGTAFSVKIASRSLEVLVTEGKVSFEALEPEISADEVGQPLDLETPTTVKELEAGQRAVQELSRETFEPKVYEVSVTEVATRLAWRDAILDFNSSPLSEVVSAFNRHNHVQIVIGDEDLLDMKVTVALKPDNHEGFVRLLEMTAGIDAVSQGNSTVILRKKK